MDSALTSVGLPVALAVVMFGLGLSLTVADFARIAREPRAVAAFADRADKPVRIFSAVVLVAVIAGTIVAERENIGGYLADIGLVTVLFCACSLTAGYLIPRLAKVGKRQAIASAFEVGIHNSTLAITVAVTVLGSEQLAVPAAVYGVVMFPLAAVAGYLLTRVKAERDAVAG